MRNADFACSCIHVAQGQYRDVITSISMGTWYKSDPKPGSNQLQKLRIIHGLRDWGSEGGDKLHMIRIRAIGPVYQRMLPQIGQM